MAFYYKFTCLRSHARHSQIYDVLLYKIRVVMPHELVSTNCAKCACNTKLRQKATLVFHVVQAPLPAAEAQASTMHTCRQHEGERGHHRAEQPTPGAEQKAKPAAAVAAGQQRAGAGGDTYQEELIEDHHEEVVAPARDEHAQDSNLNLARTAHSSTRDQPSCCHEQYRHQGQ